MRTSIFIWLILSSTTFYGQKGLPGLYERKWSAHSSLKLLPDSTFEEKYLSFSCGMYASVFKDSVYRGTWSVNKNVLTLSFNHTDHDKDWNVSKYGIDASTNQLIQIGIKDASFLNYIKTKEFDIAGNTTWELNPNDLITSLEKLPYDKESSKRDQLVFLLKFWSENQPGFRIDSYRDYNFDVLHISPYSMINQIYFVGQLKYMLSNPGDTSVVNQKKAGLTAVATAYSNGLYKKYKNKKMENLVAMEANGELDAYIRRKLQ